MSLRAYLKKLETQSRLVKVTEPISKQYQLAGVLKKLEPTPLLFESAKESEFRVVGNLFCTKAAFAGYFGLAVAELIPTLARAIDRRSPGEVVEQAPCQEVVNLKPTLDRLPILRHCERDGGNYISSGVVIAKHPEYGQNADFHRCMQFSETEMAMRVVGSRHFDTYLQALKQVDVAVCVGNAPNVLAAAAMSVALGIDELEIATSC